MVSYHRITSLEFDGGFLDGMRFDFHDDLSCIIGGRGTGKTTVLEAIRFALDRLPDSAKYRPRRQHIDSLLQNNVASGAIRARVTTRDGATYEVVRSVNAEPVVADEDGRVVDINIGGDIVFGVDIYSQNEIEDIANDAFFQLQLIDKFVQADVSELESRIATTVRRLDVNARGILERRRVVDDLIEATKELPDIVEKLRRIEQSDSAPAELQTEHERRRERLREAQLAERAQSFADASAVRLQKLANDIAHECTETLEVEVQGPNHQLVMAVVNRVRAASESIASALRSAEVDAAKLSAELAPLAKQLQQRHVQQDQVLREVIELHDREREKDAERTRLEKRSLELQSLAKKLAKGRTELVQLNREREELRAQLSDLRDQRFQLRERVSKQLNDELSPMIRVELEQFGNADAYRAMLMQAMKGSGLRYRSIVDRAVDRLPPAELASLVQGNDREGLERELDLDSDRATRFMLQLKDQPDVFALEVVELHDKPTLQLKDGEDYKDSTQLSTGQKCTTILPILLLESERPLLIDQPEDNLDNAFIFDTIVPSIRAVRGRRQLIFVTHNPNIPVLGDAGRVFCLQSTGRAATIAGSGTVDEVAREIMTVLEGGREAFEARRQRYGEPVPAEQ